MADDTLWSVLVLVLLGAGAIALYDLALPSNAAEVTVGMAELLSGLATLIILMILAAAGAYLTETPGRW